MVDVHGWLWLTKDSHGWSWLTLVDHVWLIYHRKLWSNWSKHIHPLLTWFPKVNYGWLNLTWLNMVEHGFSHGEHGWPSCIWVTKVYILDAHVTFTNMNTKLIIWIWWTWFTNVVDHVVYGWLWLMKDDHGWPKLIKVH